MAATDTDRLAAEYDVLAESCGMVDRSDRGKLALTGADAAGFLNGQVTNDIATLLPGQGCYAAFLTHKGKMLGDLRVLAVGAGAEGRRQATSELLLDTERVALQALFDMIRRFKVGHRVELHKRTLERSLLSLIGPRAREAAAAASGRSPSALALVLEEHASRPASIDGVPVLLVSTYARGIDVLFESAALDVVAAALVRGGARDVSPSAAEIVRVECGRPRYGVDLDDSVIPQEAGLNERAVSFNKGCYVGQETVARLHYKGRPNRHLRGLILDGPAVGGEVLRLGEREVGRLGSAVLSPRLGPIGLAIVRREAEPGASLTLGDHGMSARVTALPFTS